MQDPQFERGVWVVAHTASKVYIGQIAENGERQTPATVLADPIVKLDNAVELSIIAIVGRDSAGTPVPMHSISMNPLGFADTPSSVHIRWTALQFFSELNEETRKRYAHDYQKLLEGLTAARAKSAGLVLPR